jgi:hypothetical protein
MVKLVTQAFLDMNGVAMPIKILKYDNNKYVTFQHEDGSIAEDKIGYIKADRELKRRIPYVNWFIHGGGKRKDYRPRQRRVNWYYHTDSGTVSFDNKKDALRAALSQARAHGKEVEIRQAHRFTYGSGRGGVGFGIAFIIVWPCGTAWQYDSNRRSDKGWDPKALRGYGKLPNGSGERYIRGGK